MQEFQWKISAQQYAAAEELPAADAELLEEAKAALAKSYSPYSRFKVGAAIRLANGVVLSGANFENAAYPMCLCAERSVLAAAASTHPGVAVVAMAITVQNPAKPVLMPAAPCGACRQVMAETEAFHAQDMRVLLQGESGPVLAFRAAKDFLPLYFDSGFLV